MPPGFTERNPTGPVVPQGDWVGFERPDWLDPRSEAFPRVAASFYRHQRELFGESTMYKMDLLHEGGRPGERACPGRGPSGDERLQTARAPAPCGP